MRRVFHFDRALRPGRVGRIAFQLVASGTAAGIVGFTMAHRVQREEIALRTDRVVVAGEQLTLSQTPGKTTVEESNDGTTAIGSPVPIEVRPADIESSDIGTSPEAPGSGEGSGPGIQLTDPLSVPTTTAVPRGRSPRSPSTQTARPTPTSAPLRNVPRTNSGSGETSSGSNGGSEPDADAATDPFGNISNPATDDGPPATLVLVAGPPFTPNTSNLPTTTQPIEPSRTTEPTPDPVDEPAPPSTTRPTPSTTRLTPTTSKAAPTTTKSVAVTKAPSVSATTAIPATATPTTPRPDRPRRLLPRYRQVVSRRPPPRPLRCHRR